jgi:hypothetical protein
VAEGNLPGGQVMDGTMATVTGGAAATIITRLLRDGIAIGIVAGRGRMGGALVLLGRWLAVLLLRWRVLLLLRWRVLLLISALVLRRVLAVAVLLGGRLAILLGRRLAVSLGRRGILSVLRLRGLLISSAAVPLGWWCAGAVVTLARISAV